MVAYLNEVLSILITTHSNFLSLLLIKRIIILPRKIKNLIHGVGSTKSQSQLDAQTSSEFRKLSKKKLCNVILHSLESQTKTGVITKTKISFCQLYECFIGVERT